MSSDDLWQEVLRQNPKLDKPETEIVRLAIRNLRKLCDVAYCAGYKDGSGDDINDAATDLPPTQPLGSADFGDIFNSLMRGRRP